MESQESKNLVFLNEEYIKLRNSKIYQNALRKQKIYENLRNGGLSYIFHYLKWRASKSKTDIEIRETIIPSIGQNLNARVAVYTCITGNYDTIKEPLYVNSCVDYFIVTDMDVPKESVWKKIDINNISELQGLSDVDKNRFIKFFPHVLFPEYDYSVYVDGVIQIVGDIMPLIESMGTCIFGVHRHNARNCIYEEAKAVIYAKRAPKQQVLCHIEKYKQENYPKNNGLYENTVLIRKHNDDKCIKLMETWWDEYIVSCKRDQLSLPYVIWKDKFELKDIFIIGCNLDNNPRFKRTYRHKT